MVPSAELPRADSRLRDMPAVEFRSLPETRKAAASCTRCPLYRNATQTVFGEGRAGAVVMLVGEQPGDAEDRAGKPFVGPAGRILDQALEKAGIDRGSVYVTNAVKHFKNVPRGKKRIHKKPDTGEIEICKWWLDLELAFVRPRLVVALGATAARALLGRPTPIEANRGKLIARADGLDVLITAHPSFVLRQREAADRERAFEKLAVDLTQAAARLAVLEHA